MGPESLGLAGLNRCDTAGSADLSACCCHDSTECKLEGPVTTDLDWQSSLKYRENAPLLLNKLLWSRQVNTGSANPVDFCTTASHTNTFWLLSDVSPESRRITAGSQRITEVLSFE